MVVLASAYGFSKCCFVFQIFCRVPQSQPFCNVKILNSFVRTFQICKYSIEESIRREMSGDLRDGMVAIGEFKAKFLSRSFQDAPHA